MGEGTRSDADEGVEQSLQRRPGIIEGQISSVRRRHGASADRLDMLREIHAARGALVNAARLAIEHELGERFDKRPAEATGKRSDQIKQALQVYRRVLEC